MIQALKNPSLFRPTSRPTSPNPVPDSGNVERSRTLNRLSFTGFRRPSSLTPAASPSPTPLVQDGFYLEALSLKLSEAVTRAFAQPPGAASSNELLGGRRPIPAGRGQALGLLIASELKAARNSPHLHRAILRSLHKPLSVLLNNISALLLPLLSSPAFLQPPAPTLQASNPNATQLHALATAHFAGELLLVFDDMALGLDNDARGDGLKPIREGLVSIIGRVVNPLIAGIKSELMPLIEALEHPVSVTVPKSATKTTPILHPSITSLQSLMPIYARSLARYTTSRTSQATLAVFLISVVWRALVALSHRPCVCSSPRSAPGSPQMLPTSSRSRRSSSGNTPPVTPPVGRFTLKLPPSRPPSPPNVIMTSTAAADARALYDLILLLPRPPADCETSLDAREAVDGALADLKALVTLLETMDNPDNLFFKINQCTDEALAGVEALTNDLPTLIALPILLRGHSSAQMSGAMATVASMVNIPEDQYRKRCLSGFGRAEECGPVVGQSVLDALREQPGSDSQPCVLLSWLETRIGDH
ncbi:hypothetical protein F5I97DRAFT_723940 [Phlebopus sp. FC_14]|nr:hypothetical protein F5I97DRAFT_723940 [Phlebopus sp. FC_14]